MWRNVFSSQSLDRAVGSMAAAAAMFVLLSSAVVAQEPQTWDAGRLQLTRAELELLLQKYDETGRSASYSNDFKVRARSEADLIRRRLTEGDFQVGDQIEIAIDGEKDSPFSLKVEPGRVLTIPNLGQLPLTGVLRSELQEKALEHVKRFIKTPAVRTRSFVRVAIMGRVASPGWRTVASEALLSDVIMTAGGPTATANLAAARVERGTARIWEGQVLQDAIAEGRTLDQMSLRSGDQLFVPETTAGKGSSVMKVITVIPALILAIGGLAQIL